MESAPEKVTAKSPGANITTELAGRRTGMAFHRTRLAADRTLMAVIRTSLSMIGFGFTIFQFFTKLTQGGVLPTESHTARNFGFALVSLGVVLLTIGIWYHVRFMLGLRARRSSLAADGLVHAESEFPVSLVLIVAVLLFLIGLLAVIGMVFRVGPLA